RFRDAAVPVALRTAIPQSARTLAAGASETEAHRAGHLRHVPAAIAFRTGSVRTGAVTCRAGLLAIHAQANLRAADGLPEIDIQAILEIGTFLRSLLRGAFRAGEPLVEDVLEIS